MSVLAFQMRLSLRPPMGLINPAATWEHRDFPGKSMTRGRLPCCKKVWARTEPASPPPKMKQSYLRAVLAIVSAIERKDKERDCMEAGLF